MSTPLPRGAAVRRLLAGAGGQLALLFALVAVAGLAYEAGSRHRAHEPLRGAAAVGAPAPAGGADGHAHGVAPAAPKVLGWACAMNCLPPLPEPGRCPVCGMEMQPIVEEAAAPPASTRAAGTTLTLSPEAAALARVATARVERRWVDHVVRMVGAVDYDETRLARVTAYVGGRLDRVFVDYTGITVRRGDHMVSIYSPELLAAQEELLLAQRAARERGDGAEELAGSSGLGAWRSSARAVASTRERLRLWGMTEGQLDALVERGAADDHLTLEAPLGGVVIERYVKEGDYVAVGDPLFAIADLSTLWVRLRAFESDLPWLRFGQDVAFVADALPGREFHGRIAFLSPTLDAATRTVDVRVNVANPDEVLKPGMFVRARVRSRLATAGRVLEPDLAGKWISPMHPEVIKDGPGSCDVCGMDLVPAAELGFVAAADPGEAPLVVPASAPLITGERALVYVVVPGAATPTFEAREVVLGARAGDWRLVESGLAEGEEVVARGAFRIDASLQIQGRPSLMNPRGERTLTGHEGHGAAPAAPSSPAAPAGAPAAPAGHAEHDPVAGVAAGEAARAAAGELLARYLDAATALADDDPARSRAAAVALHRAARAFAAEAGPGGADFAADLLGDAVALRGAETIDAARAAFGPVSRRLLALRDHLDLRLADAGLLLVHCPMAFDDAGASWLQREGEVANPYFGAAMLRCGAARAAWPAATPAGAAAR